MEKEEEIGDKIRRLRREIERHEQLYRVENNPEISDSEFDRLVKELEILERENPLFASPESPTQKVGDDRIRGFETVEHLERMQSLDNTYNENELRAFDKRLRGLLASDDLEYLVEAKLDGLAISVTYRSGKLWRAVTRGNGESGDVVTENVRTIQTLPEKLEGDKFPELIEIRGEIYMTRAEFDRINREREKLGEAKYMNPRNLASGTLKQLDVDVVRKRKLEIVLYGVGAVEGWSFSKQSALKDCFKKWGLPTLEQSEVVHGIDEAWKAVGELDKWRTSAAYPTDGAVIKLNDRAGQAQVGSTSKAPRWAISYKFSAEQAETSINRISIQLGRTGALTPVAELEPVEIAGTMVSRATLHNEDEIARKDVREGDVVIVEKAGEIIPAIVRVVTEKRPEGLQAFDFQARLKELGYEAKRTEGESVWRLVGPGTPERLQRQIQHFSGRTAMDIDGLGKEIIRQLVQMGLVNTISDVYVLKKEQLVELEKFGEKSAENLLAALESSKENDLWRLLHGLGIPHVGAEAAKTLAREFQKLDSLMSAPLEALTAIDGIGPKMAEAIVQWFSEDSNRVELSRLMELGLRGESSLKPVKQEEVSGAVAGKTFVLTGTLPNWTRDEAKGFIEAAGGSVTGSVSGKTNYLVAGESAGSKLTKAEKLGVQIIDEAQLKELLATKGDDSAAGEDTSSHVE